MNSIPRELEPKTPQEACRVARRALVLAALVCRGSIEYGAGQAEADALHPRILDWLTRIALWAEVEPEERTTFEAPMGTLTLKQVLRATGYAEGLAILAWALRLLELPRHDRKVDPYEVTDAVQFLGEDAGELIQTARLQSLIELQACRELHYDIHVRLRDFIRHRDTKNIRHWIDPAWLEALKIDVADLLVNNDLAIDDKAISETDLARVQECSSIAHERHRAIIWLVEGYPVYSQTPVDT